MSAFALATASAEAVCLFHSNERNLLFDTRTLQIDKYKMSFFTKSFILEAFSALKCGNKNQKQDLQKL